MGRLMAMTAQARRRGRGGEPSSSSQRTAAKGGARRAAARRVARRSGGGDGWEGWGGEQVPQQQQRERRERRERDGTARGGSRGDESAWAGGSGTARPQSGGGVRTRPEVIALTDQESTSVLPWSTGMQFNYYFGDFDSWAPRFGFCIASALVAGQFSPLLGSAAMIYPIVVRLRTHTHTHTHLLRPTFSQRALETQPIPLPFHSFIQTKRNET